jgi:LuxR family maltose regulon positive regulatory protein
MKSEVLPEVNVARTVAPLVPATFLSRKHLFNLFETAVPGATVIAAPAGYGKTILAAEWAKAQSRPTVWFSVDENDSPQMFFSHIVQSVRNVLPNFANSYETERLLSPKSYIEYLVRAALEVNQEFNFIIDNGVSDAEEISPFAQALVDLLPNNVHLIIIRRVTPETSLARYASKGNLSLITSQDLKFSDEEISLICDLNSVDSTDPQITKILSKCSGWPAAVQMMSRNISRGVVDSNFKLTESTNPLGILALESFNSLNPENRRKLLKLAIVEKFDLEVAKIILGNDYAETYLNKLATDGMFISVSSGIQRKYSINPIIFDVLQELRSKIQKDDAEVHKNLANYFQSIGSNAQAIEHVFYSGSQEEMSNILRASIREMAAIGRGDQIIRWARYGADDTPIGEVMKKAIEIVGYLVNLDFARVESMSSELNFISRQNPQMEFLTQLTSMVMSHVYFARGDFERCNEMINEALASDYGIAGIENVDKIALLRLQADIAYLYDDPELIEKCLLKAKNLADGNNSLITGYHIGCMTALSLWSQGKFFEAAEFATIAISQAENNYFSGIAAPFDALLVLSRCQLELSQLDKAIERCNSISIMAESSGIWPWFFMATGTSSRIQITQGFKTKIADSVSELRSKLKNLNTVNQLSWMIDMTDVFLRFEMRDWKRAEELLKRMPNIEMVRQIDMNVKFEADQKRVHALVDKMPESTPRERVNKYLYLATINIDQEKNALKYLSLALNLGSEVGFHEYFVRQSRLYPLMVKAATAKPTIFHESIINEMSRRMNAQNLESNSFDNKLTNRELEILKHLTTGNSVVSIARQLHISQNTMKTHLRNLYRKLEASGRHSAVEKAKKLLLI